MHDEDCCENCMFFVREKITNVEEHRMEPTARENMWYPQTVFESALYPRIPITPQVFRTAQTIPSYCRRYPARRDKDKAEWCGEYKAKD